jgi:hypothetical protein
LSGSIGRGVPHNALVAATLRWFVYVVALGGVAVVVFVRWRSRQSRLDVGAVSHQWLAQHHLDSPITKPE